LAHPPAFKPAQNGGQPAAAAGAPGLLLRLAVMTYEAVLLFGLVFAVSYIVLALAGWRYPLLPDQRLLLQAVLFLAIGAYFIYCWVRAGQTLAMKSWRLRIVDRDGGPLSATRAALRYLLAWSLFAPGLLFVAVADADILWNLLAIVAGALAMMFTAHFDPQRQLLHDRLLGSRVIRE
jgi:uncharacterized RDD family membrane protein YckC